MNTTTIAAARVAAAEMLARLDDPESRDEIVTQLLDDVPEDQGLESLGGVVAFLLDTIDAIATHSPTSRRVIAHTIASLLTPLTRSQRRALERDARRGR